MNRRAFLALGAGAAAGELFLPARALAAPRCSAQDANHETTCEVEICGLLSAVVPAVQRENQWCWAACIEMAFRCSGHPLSQERIVQETWGQIVNMPANGEQIFAAINRSYTDALGQSFKVTGRLVRIGERFMEGANLAYGELAANHPVIVAGNHHAMMLRKLTVRRDNVGFRTRFVTADVLDPWPGHGMRRLTDREWSELYYLAIVAVT